MINKILVLIIGLIISQPVLALVTPPDKTIVRPDGRSGTGGGTNCPICK